MGAVVSWRILRYLSSCIYLAPLLPLRGLGQAFVEPFSGPEAKNGHLNFRHSRLGHSTSQAYRWLWLRESRVIHIPLQASTPPQSRSGPTAPDSISVHILRRGKDRQRSGDAHPSDGEPEVVITVVGKVALDRVLSSDRVIKGGWTSVRS